jgi:hypothetical protein
MRTRDFVRRLNELSLLRSDTAGKGGAACGRRGAAAGWAICRRSGRALEVSSVL